MPNKSAPAKSTSPIPAQASSAVITQKKKSIAKKMRPIFNAKTGGSKGWTNPAKVQGQDAGRNSLRGIGKTKTSSGVSRGSNG